MRPLILIGENSTKVTERALLKSAGGGSDGRATDTLTAAPPTHIIYGLRVGQYSGNGLAALAPRRPLPSPRAAAASIELPGGGSVPLPVLPLLPSFLPSFRPSLLPVSFAREQCALCATLLENRAALNRPRSKVT